MGDSVSQEKKKRGKKEKIETQDDYLVEMFFRRENHLQKSLIRATRKKGKKKLNTFIYKTGTDKLV